MVDDVQHPGYYTGTLVVVRGSMVTEHGRLLAPVECWDLQVALGLPHLPAAALKYLWRAGKKQGQSALKDTEKAIAYLQRHAEELRCESGHK